jgi:3-hydroxyacyl-CoA dehydrogenase / enoyl-CoA hydratase / 3-hydroxybutyryl-CoA epimerase
VTSLGYEVIDGVALVTLDVPGAALNTLSISMAREFGELLDRLERDALVTAAVLISGKEDNFIAGADIEQLRGASSAADAEAMSREGQEFFNRIERLRFPLVAAIHGACLGGGLEAALACRYRIATDHPKTVLALPEVQLGLIPGAGGTQRLPRKVGLQAALDMILTGRNIRAKKALQIGLVEELVHPAILRSVALARARELASGTTRRPSVKKGTAVGRLIEGNPLGRSVVFRKARESVMQKTGGHYPAPLAALEVVQAGYERGFNRGLVEEARHFGLLTQTSVARELMFLFFATTSLKKDPGVEGEAPEPAEIRKLGVLGAGFMGAGIASIAVQQGTTVRLKDMDHARLGKGLIAVRDVLRERLRKRQITRLQYQDMMMLVGATAEYTGFASVDLAIEAVFEDLDLKHRVLREVEPLLPERAIYASNTSTIPIARIAEAAARPDRVLGMHFFSPVHRMPLLEVIVTPQTSPDAAVTAVAYGRKLGKTVIVVNDGPGFYTTRTLAAYLNEAGMLLDEGARIETIDRALTSFGFPVGPITLMDEVGIDVGGKVGAVLAEAFGTRISPSDAMRRVVGSGRTGRKGRKGFYLYDQSGKKGDPDPTVYAVMGSSDAGRVEIAAGEIVERCVLAMVNEAVRCLEEGILRSPRDGDIGAVFGIGFPPFLGGPFRYAHAAGPAAIVRRLEALDERHRGRFRPAEMLREMASTGRSFY